MTATPDSVPDHVRGVITSRPNGAGLSRNPEYIGSETIGASREDRSKMAYSEGILPTGETLSFDVEAQYNASSLKEIATRDYTTTGTLGVKMAQYGLSRDRAQELRAQPARLWGHGPDTAGTETRGQGSEEAETTGAKGAAEAAPAALPDPASPAATPEPGASELEISSVRGEAQTGQSQLLDTATGTYTGESATDKLAQGDEADITEPVNIDIAEHTTGSSEGQNHATPGRPVSIASQTTTATTVTDDDRDGEDDEDAITVDPKEFVEGWTELTRTQRRRVMREIGVVPVDELDQSLDDSDKDVEEVRTQLEKVRSELEKTRAELDEALEDKRLYRNQVEQLQQASAAEPAREPARSAEKEASTHAEDAAESTTTEAAAEAASAPISTDDIPYE